MTVTKTKKEAMLEKNMQSSDCNEGAGQKVPETTPADVPGAILDDDITGRLVVYDTLCAVVTRRWLRWRHERSLFGRDLTSCWRLHGNGGGGSSGC